MSRNRVAAALSLSGVLLAGTAAALVNSQVLSSERDPLPAAAVPAVTVTSAGSVPTTVPVVDATSPAPAPTQAEYQVGESGTVVLDTLDGVLRLVAATPNPGWLVVAAEQDDPTQVRVEFQSFTTMVTFRASVLFGVVSTEVESSVATTTGGPVGSTPSSGSTPGAGSTPSSGPTPGAGSTVTTIDDGPDEPDQPDEPDEPDEPDDD